MSDVLYRLFDETGGLLYVGITGQPRRRLAAHRHSQPWWSEVSRVEIEPHADRTSARAAELRAIRHERPRYNVADTVVSPQDPFMAAVRAAAERYCATSAALNEARRSLHVAIRQELAAGLPIGQVARESRFDREHVRRIRDGK